MKKVLAASWHPGGVNAITPVIKRLREEGKVQVVVIGHDEPSKRILQKAGVTYKTIKDYSFDDVSQASMDAVVKKENPDMVLTGTSQQDMEHFDVIEQTITLAAKKKKVPTLAVLDIWGGYIARFSNRYTRDSYTRFKFIPDRIAIMDDIAKAHMLKEGFDESRLVVTGNPYFDDVMSAKEDFSNKDELRVRQELGVDIDAKLIAYASQPLTSPPSHELGYTRKELVEELMNAADSLYDKIKTHVLVMTHPREKGKESDLEEVMRRFGVPSSLDKEYDRKIAMLASDVVVSASSTLLVVGCYMDKPVISLQPGLKIKDPCHINSTGATVPIYKKRELKDVLPKLLLDPSAFNEVRINRAELQTDGKATERVTQLVYDMVA